MPHSLCAASSSPEEEIYMDDPPAGAAAAVGVVVPSIVARLLCSRVTRTPFAMSLLTVGGLGGALPQTRAVDAINRHLVLGHEIADH